MSDAKEKKDNLITVYKAAQSLGIKAEVLQYQIDAGNIDSVEGMVYESVCDKISEQQATYIGIKAFLQNHNSDRFESKYVKNRNKYIDFLEDNAYFGIEIVEPDNILFDLPEREDFYITREDAQMFEYKSEQFFEEFGLTEEEKVRWIINHSKGHPLTTEYIKKYLIYIEDEDNIYTPSLTAFVRTIFDMSDIKKLTDEDIVSAIENADAVRTKNLLTDFFKYVAKYETVKYHNVELKKKESDSEPAYPYQFRSTFVRELIKRKVPIAMIMKQYSHVSIEMTAHYLTLQEEEVKEIYSDMILSPESKIAGLRAKEIKGKLDDLFHGKTEDEIDDVISGLAKTMSFNPLPTGVCLYDFRRGNCTDGDGCFFYNCPNYITEVQFYPILKDELDLLEKEMVRLKELGQEPAYQVQAVKYKYLKPLVESLEVQLNGKESVG